MRRQLELLGIPYRLSHRLVRGLDYYVRTTFEVLSGELGAQNSVLGGGRYDGLVRDLGGRDAAGIGFAVGLERLGLLAPGARGTGGAATSSSSPWPASALDPALVLQRDLRRAGVRAMLGPEGRSFKSRMKQANKLGARFVAILGEDEIARGVWTMRDMDAIGAGGRPAGAGPRAPQGEDEWLRAWATSPAPTTAGSCGPSTSGRPSPSWVGPRPAVTSGG